MTFLEIGNTAAGLDASLAKPLCSACATTDGCEEHGLFTCPICLRAVRISSGGSEPKDEGGEWCSDCWAELNKAKDSEVPDGHG